MMAAEAKRLTATTRTVLMVAPGEVEGLEEAVGGRGSIVTAAEGRRAIEQ
jgi:hypothetical protein